MAPSFRPGKGRSPREDEDFFEAKGDRKTRKPLVEKKRRARINESLQELRLLLADSEFQAKLENAEVLELTVRRVQAVLESRSRGECWRRGGPGRAGAARGLARPPAPHGAPLCVSPGAAGAAEGGRLHREASERFAAGYIQCMHEVHTFVSSCPGIDATTAAELLNHLLESMPLNEGAFQDLIADALAEPSPGLGPGPWPGGEALVPLAEATLGLALPASVLSPSSGEETCSDSEETEAEPSQTAADGLDASRTRSVPSSSFSKSMWRPW
ncbi:transcription cofactor HES-6-like isoform X1 [Apteryx mantelli]|uniref:Transcription cofactor HES-6-like isoform X1 n=1 Tax=Apteryx mantelli TaxID=2696672 RepID=A0ABM4EZE2_9AVES